MNSSIYQICLPSGLQQLQVGKSFNFFESPDPLQENSYMFEDIHIRPKFKFRFNPDVIKDGNHLPLDNLKNSVSPQDKYISASKMDEGTGCLVILRLWPRSLSALKSESSPVISFWALILGQRNIDSIQ